MNIIRLITNFKFKNKTFIIHNIILILLFTFIYKNIAEKYGNITEKNNLNTYENSLYYTCVTHFGIGYGDIVPQTVYMKRSCMLHILLVFLIILY